jgi:uncharacterized protein (TIGR02145 family)
MKKLLIIGIGCLLTVLIFVFPKSLKSHGSHPDQPEYGNFTDERDGHTYKTVRIGRQWMMAENFAYRPNQGNYWAYGNDTANIARYGYLYDWETAGRIAPPGWHLPSEKEWKAFRKSLGATMDLWFTMGKVYKQMISGGSSGFNALFGGAYIISDDEFRNSGDVSYFWSSTLTDDGPVNYVVDRESETAFLTGFGDPRGGKSVRLFRDQTRK